MELTICKASRALPRSFTTMIQSRSTLSGLETKIRGLNLLLANPVTMQILSYSPHFEKLEDDLFCPRAPRSSEQTHQSIYLSIPSSRQKFRLRPLMSRQITQELFILGIQPSHPPAPKGWLRHQHERVGRW